MLTQPHTQTTNERFAPVRRMRRRNNPYLTPLAIVLAGLMISGAFFYTRGGDTTAPTPESSKREISIRSLTADDWVRGNPNAPIVLVEYSDFECPYCGTFHQTMKRIMETYGVNGQVAWVYRHFPIEALHAHAWKAAIAAECAGELGGNDAFWQYADLIFTHTASGNTLDLSIFQKFAGQSGLNREAFAGCLETERTKPKVSEDYTEATEGAFGAGTPHNVLIVGNQKVAIPGSFTYEELSALFDTILRQFTDASKISAPTQE